MRALIALTVAMGVLILVGSTVLVVALVKRSSSPEAPPGAFSVTLDEPTGTRITGVAGTADRLAITLQGGGPDRVVLTDPRSGAVLGRIGLSH